MGRNNNNIKLAKKIGYKFTISQLKKWNVKFDKLFFGKPSSDVYIDDQSLNFKKCSHHVFEKRKRKTPFDEKTGTISFVSNATKRTVLQKVMKKKKMPLTVINKILRFFRLPGFIWK